MQSVRSSGCMKIVKRGFCSSGVTRTAHSSSTGRDAISRYSAICDFFQSINSDGMRQAATSKQLLTPSRYHVRTQPLHHASNSRSFHTSHHRKKEDTPRLSSEGKHESDHQKPDVSNKKNPQTESTPEPVDTSYLENYSRLFRQLVQSVPHIHRPTRDDLLSVTNSFWERLGIRFKWLTIRSFRKFNADDISAFFSFAIMGQTLWILIGTTTFVSVIIAAINSLRLQSYVAHAISDHLTQETGIIVAFESAIVPKWKDSKISFKNVYISRRPNEMESQLSEVERGRRAAARFDIGPGPLHFHEDDYPILAPIAPIYEEANMSMFDLNVDSIDVTLSLTRWLDGKGLVQNAEVRGVRGVLDRRSVTWDPDKPPDPVDYRLKAKPGDFHLESLRLEDVLITVYQPYHFRPFSLSIFHADLNCLRKQWFCCDFLRADNMAGQIDNCQFSLHRPQSIGRTVDTEMKELPWDCMTRFRIDGLNVDHLQAMTIGGGAADGPISWITSGKFDFVLDIKLPRARNQDFDINAIVSEIAANISTVTTKDRIPGQRVLAKPALTPPSDGTGEDPTSQVSVDVDLRFRDVRAAVPLFANELSSVNSALIRPIVAFLNANHTLIPIRCHVAKNLSDFDGSFTLWETGLTDAIGLKVYDALAHHVTHANINSRVRTVGLWSLQQMTRAMVGMVRSAIEPLTNNVQRRLE